MPDVAMDADPETGLTIYPGGSAATFGGTSLSAPLAAGAFASTMFSAGQPAGSRDVTTWLYSASATAGFTDVNTGNNGYAARTGWDPVTGLGAPHWTKLQARALMSPSSLASGAQLVSANGLFRAAMQGDGNFVVYGPHGALWSSHTAGNPGATLSVQFDGNLVIYRNGAIWNTHTSGHPGGTVLVMQDTGTLVLQQGGKPLWQVTDTLATPGLLVPGQQIIAANGDRAAMQGDGNFVVYGLRGALWSSRTSGNPGATLSLQSDGNLVIYRNGKAIWNTHTSGTGAQNRLVIQGDGNLVLYNSIRAVWNTHTTG